MFSHRVAVSDNVLGGKEVFAKQKFGNRRKAQTFYAVYTVFNFFPIE